MENAAEALKMATAVLIFILAIATSFSVFGTAKQTADHIINMRDKQAYLQEAEADGGILYTSSDAVTSGNADGVTTSGDRIVSFADVISTIYRYSKEKYGVTIAKKNGDVIARYDSNTEDVMRQYYNITSGIDTYIEQLKKNTATSYVEGVGVRKGVLKFSEEKLKEIYAIDVTGNSTIRCGAPWYGNDEQIQKRINADINGKEYKYYGQTYQGKNLNNILKGKKIVEVTNEIDKSKYIENAGQSTGLLEMYNMPTIEIVYIILD